LSDTYTNRYTNGLNLLNTARTLLSVIRCGVMTCARRGSNPQPSDPKSEVSAFRWHQHNTPPSARQSKVLPDGDPKSARTLHDSLHEFVAGSTFGVLTTADMWQLHFGRYR
jgi:hypothetical protein